MHKLDDQYKRTLNTKIKWISCIAGKNISDFKFVQVYISKNRKSNYSLIRIKSNDINPDTKTFIWQ